MQAIARGAWTTVTGTMASALRGIASVPSGALDAHYKACVADAADLRQARERFPFP